MGLSANSQNIYKSSASNHMKCIYFLHFVRYTNIRLEVEYG